jgi:hypothetical protein
LVSLINLRMDIFFLFGDGEDVFSQEMTSTAVSLSESNGMKFKSVFILCLRIFLLLLLDHSVIADQIFSSCIFIHDCRCHY